jgi:hypothetical protein
MEIRRFNRVAWGFVISLASMSTMAAAQVVDHSGGFTGQTDLTLNGTQNGAAAPVTVVAGNLQITDANGNEAKSAFTTSALPADKFRTTFKFHLLPGSTTPAPGVGMADGIGFCIQNTAATALGGTGGQMGYFGIGSSIFVKIDNYGGGIVYSATGLYLNGADPSNTANDVDLEPAPTIDFQSGHDFNCVMSYDGTTLTVTFTDLSNNNVRTQNYLVNIPTQLGGSTGFVGFSGGTGGLNAVQEVVTWIYVTAPTMLAPTHAINQVTLNWNAVAGATSYNVYRGTASGGPYPIQVATGVIGTSAVDNGAQWPGPYYYVVRAVVAGFEGPNSNEATGTPDPPQVSVSPTSITTSESGTSVNLTLTINVSPSVASTIQVTSNVLSGVPAQASVSGQGQGPANTITINVPAGATVGTAYTVTVAGLDDHLVNGNQSYTIDFVVSETGGPGTWAGATITQVTGTNLEADTAGLIVNPASGLQTDTNGGFATFTVQLNSKPVNPVNISVTSSDITEVTVSTPTLVFDTNTWLTAQQVTVTGQGINITYMNAPFTITLAVVNSTSDLTYQNFTATVTGTNIHLEVPPALQKVWGGGSGGCGLLGAEVLLPLSLLALWQRRRRKA